MICCLQVLSICWNLKFSCSLQRSKCVRIKWNFSYTFIFICGIDLYRSSTILVQNNNHLDGKAESFCRKKELDPKGCRIHFAGQSRKRFVYKNVYIAKLLHLSSLFPMPSFTLSPIAQSVALGTWEPEVAGLIPGSANILSEDLW